MYEAWNETLGEKGVIRKNKKDRLYLQLETIADEKKAAYARWLGHSAELTKL